MSTSTTPEQRAAERIASILKPDYRINLDFKSIHELTEVISAEFADERKAAKELAETVENHICGSLCEGLILCVSCGCSLCKLRGAFNKFNSYFL